MKLLQIALSEFGIEEMPGEQDNPEILKYFDALGFDGKALKDETSWCSAFANYCAIKSDSIYSGALDARSWMGVGEMIAEGDQQLGDVVVFWRGSHKDEMITGTRVKKGHVGFYIREDAEHIWVLGGNQSNKVCIAPYDKKRLLGYRRITC